MTLYNTHNGAKPRYDGKGSEFGLMHRDLGKGFSMFDIDRLSAIVEVNLELKREEEGFVEYRHVGANVEFVALFEVKHHRTEWSEEALMPDKSASVARAELARRIGARLFVVFGTNGGQPFDFYEIDTETREAEHVGTLTYDLSDRNLKMQAVQSFWRECLGIARHFVS